MWVCNTFIVYCLDLLAFLRKERHKSKRSSLSKDGATDDDEDSDVAEDSPERNESESLRSQMTVDETKVFIMCFLVLSRDILSRIRTYRFMKHRPESVT